MQNFFDSDEEYGGYVPAVTTQLTKGQVWKPSTYKPPTSTYIDNCKHFRFPLPVGDGKFIYLSSSRGHDDNLRKSDAREVDYGVYLDQGWRSKLEGKSTYSGPLTRDVDVPDGFFEMWEGTVKAPQITGVYLPWTDRGAPPMSKITPLLAWINSELDTDRRIEIACMGGHGRTGTLAAMIMLSRANGKLEPLETISLIREVYCKEAIESWVQIERIYECVGQIAPEALKPKPTSYSTGGKGTTSSAYSKGSRYMPQAIMNMVRDFNTKTPEKRLGIPITLGMRRKEIKSNNPIAAATVPHVG